MKLYPSITFTLSIVGMISFFVLSCCEDPAPTPCNLPILDADVTITELDDVVIADLPSPTTTILIDKDSIQGYRLRGTATRLPCEDGQNVTGTVFAAVDPTASGLFLQGSTSSASKEAETWNLAIFFNGNSGDEATVRAFIVRSEDADFVRSLGASYADFNAFFSEFTSKSIFYQESEEINIELK